MHHCYKAVTMEVGHVLLMKGLALMKSGQDDNGLKELYKVKDEVGQVRDSSSLQIFASANYQIATHFYNLASYDAAQKFLDDVVDVFRGSDIGYTPIMSDLYMLRGNVEVKKIDYSRGREFFFLAQQNNALASEQNQATALKVYQSIGASYMQEGVVGKAKDYFQKAIFIQREILPAGHPEISTTLYSLSLVKMIEKDYKAALVSLHEALASQQLPLINKIVINLQLAQVYSLSDKFESANETILKVQSIINTAGLQDHPVLSMNLNMIHSICLMEEEKSEEAINIYDALSDRPAITSAEERVLFLNKGRCYYLLGDEESGDAAYVKGFAAANLTMDDLNPDDIINLSIASKAVGNYAESLHHYASQTEDAKDYLRTLDFTERGISFFRDIYVNNFELESKQEIKLQWRKVLEAHINANIGLYHIDNDVDRLSAAYEACELSKAQEILDAATNTINLRDRNGISVLKRLKDVEAEQKYLQQLIDKNINEIVDSSLASWNEQLIVLREQQVKLTAELRSKEGYEYKYGLNDVALSDIQRSSLGDNNAIIEYFFGETFIHSFVITKDKINCFSEPYNHEYLREIKNLQLQIVNDNINENTITYLYDKLVKRPVDFLDSSVHHLTIIPDQVIGYVPFEILASTEDGPMLIERCDVSYANAGARYADAESKGVRSSKVALYAPTYNQVIKTDDGIELSSLPGALSEVNAIRDVIGGASFVGADVNQDLFAKSADKYGVIHMAMHSIMDIEQPYLSHLLFPNTEGAADDRKLYLSEIEQLNLDADLVVLSACNTGNGKVTSTDGIQSVARSFAAAGVAATVMSLWKAPDDATSQIMTSFYRHLDAGENKATALRLAKNEYRNNDLISAQQKTPYYWAGFIVNGDVSPLTMDSSSGTLWIIGGLVLLILLIYSYTKFTRT